jgi:hypothetical protein
MRRLPRGTRMEADRTTETRRRCGMLQALVPACEVTVAIGAAEQASAESSGGGRALDGDGTGPRRATGLRTKRQRCSAQSAPSTSCSSFSCASRRCGMYRSRTQYARYLQPVRGSARACARVCVRACTRVCVFWVGAGGGGGGGRASACVHACGCAGPPHLSTSPSSSSATYACRSEKRWLMLAGGSQTRRRAPMLQHRVRAVRCLIQDRSLRANRSVY